MINIAQVQVFWGTKERIFLFVDLSFVENAEIGSLLHFVYGVVALIFNLGGTLVIYVKLFAIFGSERALTQWIVDGVKIVNKIVLLTNLILFFICSLISWSRNLVTLNSVLTGSFLISSPICFKSSNLTHSIRTKWLNIIKRIIIWTILRMV